MSRKRRRPAATTDAGSPLGGFPGRHGGRALAAALVIYAVLSLLLFDPKPFVGGDNAAYTALSKSLVQGRGLTETWSPDARPHTQYPFGFPLLLAPVSLLKLPYAWYKLVPWLSGLAGIALSWLLFRRHSAALALATALLLAINPHYLEFGHWVLSELPFLALAVLSLWLLSRWEAGGGLAWFLAAVLSVSACIHVRSAGLALLAAIPLHLAARRRYRWALLFLGAGVVLMLPWAWRNAHHGTSGGYLEQFLMRDPYQPELGKIGAGQLASRAAFNLKLYLTSIWPQLMSPGIGAWGMDRARLLWLALLSAPAIFGAAVGVRQGAAGWLVLCYLGLSLLWPEAWSDRRFALPLLPLLVFFLLQGWQLLLARVGGRAARASAWLLLPILAASSALPALGGIGPNLEMLSAYHRGDRLAGYEPQWRGFFQAAEWVRDNTPHGAVAVSRKPQLFHLASGRRAFCYPFTADADSVLSALARADYVMVEPVSGTVQRYLVPAVSPQIDRRYRVVHAAGNPTTYVLEPIKEGAHAE